MKKVLLSSLVLTMLIGFTFVISSAEEPTVYTEGNWKYITLAGNNARIIDYTGSNPVEVTVPGTLGGYTVTEMGGLEYWDGVFDDAYTLTKVALPDSIKEIGSRSFVNCRGLIEIKFPNKLEAIGDYAFAGCTNLPNLTFPNTVTIFGQKAFSDCKFTEFTVPPLVTELPESLLWNNNALTHVNLPNGLCSIGKSAFSFCTALPEITIPNSVTEIGEQAFRSCTFVDIVLPNNLTIISSGMFEYCSKLQNVTVPSSVKTIGSEAFFKCASLEGITLPEGVQEIAPIAFKECKKLALISLPSTLKTIGGEAFINCKALANITIPAGVSIQKNAFQSSGLTAMTIPSGVELVDSVFNDCQALQQITLQQGMRISGSRTFINCTALKSISLPAEVELGDYMFSGCLALEQVAFQSDLTTISESCFNNCKALKNVTLPAAANIKTNAFKSSGLTSISIPADAVLESDVFNNCLALAQVTFESGLTTISEGCFYNCSALKDVTLPAGVDINYNAFKKSGLTSINIPADAVLGKGAFSYCAALQQVTLQPSSVGQTISEYCFYSCNALTNIALPAGLSIQEEAFAKTGLTSINIPADTGLSRAVFKNCLSLAQITLEPGLKTISEDCFKGCMALKGITFPAGIKIQDNAFSLTGLNSLDIPADAEVGYGAFSYCPYLQQVTLQPGLKALGANCFMGAKSLTDITIPGSVKNIPSGAFAGCALVQVNLEDGVTSIQSSAFPGCTYLHMIRIPRSVTYIAPGGTEDGSSPFAMSKMTVIYGYLNSAAHLAAYKYSIPFIDLESGQQNPLPTLTITSTQGNTIDYRGSIVLESNLDGVIWSSNNASVQLVSNGNKVTVYSLKSFTKSHNVTITATLGDLTENYEIKIKPNFLQWLQIIILFGWIWM